MKFPKIFLGFYILPTIDMILLNGRFDLRSILTVLFLLFFIFWFQTLGRIYTINKLHRNKQFDFLWFAILNSLPFILKEIKVNKKIVSFHPDKKYSNLISNIESTFFIIIFTVGISACKDVFESTGPLYHDEWISLLQSTTLYKDDKKVVMLFVTKYLLENLLLTIFVLFLFYFLTQYEFTIYKYNFTLTYRMLSIIYLVSMISLAIPLYKPNTLTSSEFLRENSVIPDMKVIEFPEKKKNLIFIGLEAFETMYFSKEHGGVFDVPLAPNLERIAFQNNSIFFSNLDGDKVGGVNVIPRTRFTTAAYFAMQCGYAFLSDPTPTGNVYSEQYFPKFKCIGDILKEARYNITVSYGTHPHDFGIGDLFNSHSLTQVWWRNDIDPNKKGIYVFDRKTIPFFKNVLTEMGQSKTPFFASVITTDTHEPGFVCPDCPPGESDLFSTVKCSDKRIADLLEWCKKQSWYNNTVIVLFGDHIVRGNGNPEIAEKHRFSRRPFNLIINSGLENKNNRKREFTSMDVYPTVISAIGAKLKTEQLGMGVNLFSGEQTLVEKFGLEKFIKECEGTRIFYNHVLLRKEDDIRVLGFLNGTVHA